MTFPLPHYLDGLAEDQLEPARVRFLIRLAALYHNESGVVSQLSQAIGMHERSLHSLIGLNHLKITPDTAVKIEKAVGRDRMPRELFRPDIFVTEE